MRNFYISICVVALGILSTSCAQTQEVAKTFWGSSTRALQHARKDAIKKSFNCDFPKCFEGVRKLTKAPVANDVQAYQLFLKDRNKKVIIIIGIPGNVNTTEVGVFFESLEDSRTSIEIVSLSSHAKMTAADYIFNALESQCPGSP